MSQEILVRIGESALGLDTYEMLASIKKVFTKNTAPTEHEQL